MFKHRFTRNIMPAGAPRSPKAFIDRDFVPNPTQGREAPLRIPTLVAARPHLILTLDLLKFPTITGTSRSPKGVTTQVNRFLFARLAKTLDNPNASRFAPALNFNLRFA